MPMPRRARLTYAGCALHLIQRGNNRGACFFEDEDYGLYRDLAAQAARDHGVAVHAYVLMTNHVHLLVTSASQDGASRLMKQFAGNSGNALPIPGGIGRAGQVAEGVVRGVAQQKRGLSRFPVVSLSRNVVCPGFPCAGIGDVRGSRY
jgi:REP element-mobilizing transposase RayT